MSVLGCNICEKERRTILTVNFSRNNFASEVFSGHARDEQRGQAALGSAASVSVVAARHARRSHRNIIARHSRSS